MATYYAINAGGNWNAGGTWSTVATKDASRVGGATAPTATDDCILDDYSGNVTINTTTCICKTLTCTGYTGTLTFTASQRLEVRGDVIFDNTMTLAETGWLRLNASGLLTTGGLTFPGSIELYFSTGVTTLTGDLVIAGQLFNDGGASTAIAGAFDVTCDSYRSLHYKLTFPAGQTLTVVSEITTTYLYAAVGCELKSGTPSSSMYLIYQGTPANCLIVAAAFTDVDASGSAQAIDIWHGTVTRCTNINAVTSASFPAVGNVTEDDAVKGVTGTYHEATEAEVQNGVTFGADSALTGTYAGGGGVNMPRTRIGH